MVARDQRVFIGRERELDVFAAALAQARAGHGQLLLLAGEPGIGKTRLAGECAARAQTKGLRVLWGRAWEGDGAPAFWPWIQIVRAYLREADASTLRDDLGRAGREIARVMPEVEDLLPPGSRAPQSPSLGLQPEQERFRFFDGLTLFLKTASRRQPLLLVLDDLQWADTPSLLLWQFLTQELADSHLLVVGTYRDAELDAEHPLFQVLGTVRREPLFRLLTLGGLQPDEIGRYVTTISNERPSTELVAALAERTEGNPFFLRELVQLMISDGTLQGLASAQHWRQVIPIGIRQVIGRRVAGLPIECRHLLTLASAIGREFDIDLLGAVATAELEEQSAAPRRRTRAILATLEPAVVAGLLHADDATHYSFSHTMIRETLYVEQAPPMRAWLHLRIGEALERQESRAGLGELAHHFGAAGVMDKACRYARQAGDHALRALAYEEAATMYRRALEALHEAPGASQRERCLLLLAQEEAAMRGGDVQGGRALSFQAAAIARAIDDAPLFARAALGAGWHFDAGVVDHERIALLREALDRLDPADSSLRARLAARLAVTVYFDLGSYEWRAALSGEAVAMARRLGDPATLAFTLNARLYALWGPDDTAARLELSAEFLQLAETCGDLELALQSRHWLVMDLFESGQLEQVRRHMAAHAALATQQRQPLYLWGAAKWRAALATIEGRFADAEAGIAAAYEIGKRAEPRNAETSFLTQQFALLFERGDLADFADAAAQWRVENAFDAAYACGRALLFWAAGRSEALRSEMAVVEALGLENLARDVAWLPALCLLAAPASEVANEPFRERLYALLLPFRGKIAVTGMLDTCPGSISRYLGLLATSLDRPTEADAHFAEALAMHQRMSAPPLIARTQHDWAALLLRRREPGDLARALSMLDAALAAARAIGMKGLEEKAQALRLAHGVGSQVSGAVPTESANRRPDPRHPTPDTSLFRRTGDLWMITFSGTTVQLRHARGLQYLARLLAQPTRELHATELIGASGATAPSADAAQVIAADLGDAGTVLDAAATAQYQRRLAELRGELEEADANHDLGRAARLRAELEFLADQLATAGRGRRTASHAERARVTVTKGVVAAMKKIAAAHPALGRHLKATIRTGYFCSYTPDPRVDWEV